MSNKSACLLIFLFSFSIIFFIKTCVITDQTNYKPLYDDSIYLGDFIKDSRGDLKKFIIERISNNQDINIKNIAEETLLHCAVNTNDVESTKILIDAGAKINEKAYAMQCSPLHLAARSGSNKLLSLLISAGADVSIQDHYGKTPFHYVVVASRNNIEKANILLSAGADINAKDKSGETPLHKTVRGKYALMIEFLLSKGANVNAIIDSGEFVEKTALDVLEIKFMCLEKELKKENYDSYHRCKKILIKYGAKRFSELNIKQKINDDMR